MVLMTTQPVVSGIEASSEILDASRSAGGGLEMQGE